MLNSLYVTSQGAYLFKDRETVCIKIDDEIKMRLPIHTLGSIICFGQVSCSPFLLGHCAENDVSVSFLTTNGRFLARVQGEVSGNVLLRREQYRLADNELSSAKIASMMITGKVANSRHVLKRAARDHGGKIDSEPIKRAAETFASYLRRLPSESTIDGVRGIEGIVSGNYFKMFDQLILVNKDDFIFTVRSRRPPLDNVNCLLSFVYTLLYHDARSSLESVGLDPAVGFLHRDRPGRLSLALDLMEEFRPVIADRLVLSLINLKQVNAKGFIKSDSGAVTMDEDTRKTVLGAYQKKKQEEIIHPFINEKIPFGMLLFSQAQLLSRYIRGDLEAYPPFIWS
jgi:CRISPR-associated protein Cas1